VATITIQVSTGTGNVTRTRTVSGAHLTRMIAAYKGILGPNLTDEESLLAWADKVLSDTKADVLHYERNATAAGVSEITLT
jgi:hypothetical protein